MVYGTTIDTAGISKLIAGLETIALIYNVRGTHSTQATNARKIGDDRASRGCHGFLYAATKLFRAWRFQLRIPGPETAIGCSHSRDIQFS
jgi:hypothetical protein